MRRRMFSRTSVLWLLLCVVVVVALSEYIPSTTKKSATFVPAKAALRTLPALPTLEALPGTEDAARAMINFGMTLSADEIMFGSWWSGIAEGRKAGAYLRGAGVYVQLPGNGNWPIAIQEMRVVVVGRSVVRHDLPVFHVSKEPLSKGEAHAAAIPVPEGTDLYKASERTVIEDAQWCVVPDREPPPQATKSN